MDERHNVRAKTIKLLKEDTKEELYYINFSNSFCIWQQAQAAKKKQCALSKIKTLCTKGHYQLSEKATYRIEKNTHKWRIWSGINIQNAWRAAIQQQQMNKPVWKWHFSKGNNTDGQKPHAKILVIRDLKSKPQRDTTLHHLAGLLF